ncbi:MAG: hypothetical protein V2I50_08710, partial [Desulfuromusa sp.]|nr:hypothetical protein [Desulfuromusa sp.]
MQQKKLTFIKGHQGRNGATTSVLYFFTVTSPGRAPLGRDMFSAVAIITSTLASFWALEYPAAMVAA